MELEYSHEAGGSSRLRKRGSDHTYAMADSSEKRKIEPDHTYAMADSSKKRKIEPDHTYAMTGIFKKTTPDNPKKEVAQQPKRKNRCKLFYTNSLDSLRKCLAQVVSQVEATMGPKSSEIEGVERHYAYRSGK